MQQPMKTCFWAEVQACSPDLLQDALCLLLPITKTFPSNIPLSFFFWFDSDCNDLIFRLALYSFCCVVCNFLSQAVSSMVCLLPQLNFYAWPSILCCANRDSSEVWSLVWRHSIKSTPWVLYVCIITYTAVKMSRMCTLQKGGIYNLYMQNYSCKRVEIVAEQLSRQKAVIKESSF